MLISNRPSKRAWCSYNSLELTITTQLAVLVVAMMSMRVGSSVSIMIM